MKPTILAAALASAACAFAAPAFAQDSAALDARLARVEQQLAQPSPREIQSSVDAYLATTKSDASLVGGAGSAGYDGGFWIRGGSFLMKITRAPTFRINCLSAGSSPPLVLWRRESPSNTPLTAAR